MNEDDDTNGNDGMNDGDSGVSLPAQLSFRPADFMSAPDSSSASMVSSDRLAPSSSASSTGRRANAGRDTTPGITPRPIARRRQHRDVVFAHQCQGRRLAKHSSRNIYDLFHEDTAMDIAASPVILDAADADRARDPPLGYYQYYQAPTKK